MVCDYKKTGIIKVIAISTAIQAALGITIVSLLYSQLSTTSTKSTIPTTVHIQDNRTTITTESFTLETTTTTNVTLAPTGIKTEDDNDFLQFFDGVNRKAILYAGKTEVRVCYGIELIVDSLWLLSVISLRVAIGQRMGSRFRYKCLLPWIVVTTLVCILDIAGTVFFVYMLMSHGEQEVQEQLSASIRVITEFLFLQFFFSKAGVFWLVNVASVIMIAQSYSYFKEEYEEEGDYVGKSPGIELALYDGSVRHKKPYDRRYQTQMPDELDIDEQNVDSSYVNKAFEPDQIRYTTNPLHNQRYPSEPPNKYGHNGAGGDFRRFSAVDDYNAAGMPQKSGIERYLENRDQDRRESHISQNNPYQKPLQVGSDPYRKSSKGGPDPYRRPSQGGPDPYRKPSQSGAEPYRRQSRDPQLPGRTGMATPSNYGTPTTPILEEDYDLYKREQWPDIVQHSPKAREYNNYQQQKPSPRTASWGHANRSPMQEYPNADVRAQHSQSGLPYYPRPARESTLHGESQQKPATRARDQYNPPGSQVQPKQSLNPVSQHYGKKSPKKQHPSSRQDDELPMRSQLFAGLPPTGNDKNRQPSFTYLPQIQADKPYNIPRVNLK